MMDTTLRNCLRCEHETDCIEGICLPCRLKADDLDKVKVVPTLIKQRDALVDAIKTALKNMESPPVLAEGAWQTGMFCGLEDRGITDRYDACVYGYEQAIEKVKEWVIDELEQALAAITPVG